MKKLVLSSAFILMFFAYSFSQSSYSFKTTPQMISYHVQTVWAADWSKDGKELFTCGGEREIAVLNPETGELLRKIPSLPFEFYPKEITLDSSNNYFAYYIFNAYENNVVKIHEASSLKEVASIDGFEAVIGIKYSTSGEILYVSGILNNKSVIAGYNTKDGTLNKIVATENGMWCFDVSPDGKYILAGISSDKLKCFNLYEISTGTKVKSISYSGNLNTVKFSPDGKYFTAGFYENTAGIWELSTGQKIHTLSGFDGSVNAIDYSPDGKHVAITGMDLNQTFAVYNALTGELEQAMKIECPYINSISYSPDGNRLALTYTNWGDVFKTPTIRIFDLEK